MQKVIVLCGIPGAGKSSWVKEHINSFSKSTVVVSRDAIRFGLVPEGEPYFSKEKEVFSTFISNIKAALANSCDVIIDATHINEGSRSKLFRNIGDELKNCEVIAMYVKVPLDAAIANNELRAGTRGYVPESAIRNMYSQFTEPSFEEGFDKIYIYTRNNDIKYCLKEKVI